MTALDGDGDDHAVDKSLQTTRRFDALKLWMTLRVLGADGIGRLLDEAIDVAARIGRTIEADPEFELVRRPALSTVLFRPRPAVTAPDRPVTDSALTDDEADALEAVIGAVHLDGQQALAFVRSRHAQFLVDGRWRNDPRSDLSRAERQQYFLRELARTAIDSGLDDPDRVVLNLNRSDWPQMATPGVVGDDFEAGYDLDPDVPDVQNDPCTAKTLLVRAVRDDLGQRHPLQPLRHQDLLALVHHGRHYDVRVVGELLGVRLLGLGLQAVVELLGDPVAQLGDERLDVHARDQRPQQPGEPAQLRQV